MFYLNLAKVGVEGSNPFARSRIFPVAVFPEARLQRATLFAPSSALPDRVRCRAAERMCAVSVVAA